MMIDIGHRRALFFEWLHDDGRVVYFVRYHKLIALYLYFFEISYVHPDKTVDKSRKP